MEQENNMTREEAADVLSDMIYGLYPDDDITVDEEKIGAVRLAIAALPGPEWVRTADRLPTEADAGYNEVVVVALYRNSDTETVGCDYWKYVAKNPEYFPYWMPLPKLPEVEG
jgi:hypothetical protein